MAEELKSGTCNQCQAQRVVFRRGTNHILHLLLSIFTFGFWLIVWFGASVKFGGWRCQACGSTRVNNVN